MEIIVNGRPVDVSKPRQHYNDLCRDDAGCPGGCAWTDMTHTLCTNCVAEEGT